MVSIVKPATAAILTLFVAAVSATLGIVLGLLYSTHDNYPVWPPE